MQLNILYIAQKKITQTIGITTRIMIWESLKLLELLEQEKLLPAFSLEQ
jgi:hypothetical protein